MAMTKSRSEPPASDPQASELDEAALAGVSGGRKAGEGQKDGPDLPPPPPPPPPPPKFGF
jgi:hypothetical protein